MFKKILSDERHYSDFGSLKTYWLFSFSDYQDPNNMQFGNLRVFNDDIVMPGAGFPDHQHDTMEIITIVLSGTLTHKDSMGNIATIEAGEVQRMSAGEGIMHSEFNNHKEPVHLYQLWFFPNQETTAGYEQKKIKIKKNELTLLASNNQTGALNIRADAKLYQLKLETGRSLEYKISSGKGLFIYHTKGTLLVDSIECKEGSQIRITDEKTVNFSSKSDVSAIVIEVGMKI